MFPSFSLIIALSTLFSFINKKVLKLPNTIGVMILALLLAIIFLIIEQFSPLSYRFFCQIILDLDFKSLLLDVLLSFLLFAGAIHVDIRSLRKEMKSIISFATVSVMISTFLVGALFYLTTQAFGIDLPFIHCLLFGALISPTDPIAVLALLQEAGAGEEINSQIEGESLFNDGIGVVVFVSILSIATAMHGSAIDFKEIGVLLAEEALGGLLFGAVLGVLGWMMIKSVLDDPKICVMVTIAVATAGYALASILHTSGPLAMVVAGLIIGNKIFQDDHPTRTTEFIDIFWEMLDDLLNAILFVLIGLVIFTLTFQLNYLFVGLISIVLVLFSRFISVFLPTMLFNLGGEEVKKKLAVLTWGGLRGGISVALALSIPADLDSVEVILFATYMVVLFSILVQGLTIKKLVQYFDK